MSEQSYYFLSTYNLLTAIYSRYLWTKVSPCGQGIRALCGRREIFVRTEINFHAYENLTPCGRRFYDEASERKRRAKSPV